MSGGRFNYLQHNGDFDDAIETIEHHIQNNEYEFKPETIDEFKKGIELIKKARVYLQRIDYLICDDDGEDTFHERLQDDLNNTASTS